MHVTVLLYIMVKSKKGPKRGQPKAKPKQKNNMYKIKYNGSGLDGNAMKYMRLLRDPCRSDLVGPVYGAADSGYLIRVRQTYTIPSNAVDGYVGFMASAAANKTDHRSMWALGYSDTVGGTLGTISGLLGPYFLENTIVQSYRPVAGCLKVLYTGSELNRSGMIGSIISPSYVALPGQTYGPVTTLSDTSNRVSRLGSELHEVRWLPLTPADQGYSSPEESQGATSFDNTTIGFTYAGVPAGSLKIEATFVFEWIPNVTTSIPRQISAPVSRSTLQNIMASIGDAAVFATGPEGAGARSALANFANGMYNVSRMAAPAMLGF